MANQTRPSSDNVVQVHELDRNHTWIDTETAAGILGIKVSSLNYKIYGGEVYGVKMSGVLIVDKQSVIDHQKVMEERKVEQARKHDEKETVKVQKEQQKALLEKLSNLSPDQLAKLLEQTEQVPAK